MLDDGIASTTSREQWSLEIQVLKLYRDLDAMFMEHNFDALELNKRGHALFLENGLGHLSKGFLSLDSRRPWVAYWILHGMAVLGGGPPPHPSPTSVIDFLASCQDPHGGFGGGPYQLPHLAPTYAAIAALASLRDERALSAVDRVGLMDFFLRMCVPPEEGGGMVMHQGGEVDIRGCYCAIVCCHLLGLDKHLLAERCGMVDFIRRCQTYEGGLSGEPGNEAHGGYSFCGLGALFLLDALEVLDLDALVVWVAGLQAPFEGGFAGRTNKLVDGCYSYWQGAILPLLSAAGLYGSRRQALVARLRFGPEDEARAADAFVADAHCRVQAIEAEVGQAKAAFAAAVRESREAELADLKRAYQQLSQRAQRLREGLDRARSHAAAVPFGSDALVASDLGAAAVGAPGLLPGDIAGAEALQLWLLACSQLESRNGGMRDKPGRGPDYYHTCYCLSGLAVSQQWSRRVLGGAANELRPVDIACNVTVDSARCAETWRLANPLGP